MLTISSISKEKRASQSWIQIIVLHNRFPAPGEGKTDSAIMLTWSKSD